MNARKSIFPANGSSVELNNCLAEAQITLARLNADSAERVAKWIAAGKFVVMSDRPYHCRSTDAVAGSIHQTCAAYDTRAEADAAIQAAYEAGQWDDEDRPYVLPLAPTPDRSLEPVDVPF